MDIISSVVYIKKMGMMTLNPETELRVDKKSKAGDIKLIRTGLPQGLSVSPLLATLVLELSKVPKALIMYADDGVIPMRSRNEKELRDWLMTMGEMGIKTAEEKTG